MRRRKTIRQRQRQANDHDGPVIPYAAALYSRKKRAASWVSRVRSSGVSGHSLQRISNSIRPQCDWKTPIRRGHLLCTTQTQESSPSDCRVSPMIQRLSSLASIPLDHATTPQAQSIGQPKKIGDTQRVNILVSRRVPPPGGLRVACPAQAQPPHVGQLGFFFTQRKVCDGPHD